MLESSRTCAHHSEGTRCVSGFMTQTKQAAIISTLRLLAARRSQLSLKPKNCTALQWLQLGKNKFEVFVIFNKKTMMMSTIIGRTFADFNEDYKVVVVWDRLGVRMWKMLSIKRERNSMDWLNYRKGRKWLKVKVLFHRFNLNLLECQQILFRVIRRMKEKKWIWKWWRSWLYWEVRFSNWGKV